MVFLCSCKAAYHSYVSLDSAVLFCMFNLELEIPDIARLKQLKECQKAALANSFNSKKLKAKIKDKEQAEVKKAPAEVNGSPSSACSRQRTRRAPLPWPCRKARLSAPSRNN